VAESLLVACSFTAQQLVEAVEKRRDAHQATQALVPSGAPDAAGVGRVPCVPHLRP
jgi:hypothetical protein